ncbi:MAG: hypothetical protein Q8R32_03400 [bacterium]|nr:hypothetical protein [bacterium]
MSSWNEQAAAEWAAHGVFQGRMTPEEWQAGGVWLIGSKWPEGYPGKSDAVFYKSWCTWPERYTPGAYPRKDRVVQGEWEFVQVLDGCLECVVEDEGGARRFPLEHGECVDIRPEPVRYWQFAEGKQAFASGIAFFRRLGAPPIQPGAGEGYEFRLWESYQVERPPLNLPSWSVKFMEVLGWNGVIRAEVRTLAGEAKEYRLGRREYLFLHPRVNVTWRCSDKNPSGIVVYLA